MRLFSQAGGGSGGGGGGDGPFDTHWVWVSISGGSDDTGDGTVNKPFATIPHAVASITDNSADNQYTILVAPGTYVSDGITLKSWVTIAGLSQIGQIINVDGLSYDVDYDSSGSAPCSLENLILANDPVLIGDPTIHNPIFVDCIFQDGLTLTGAASFSPWGCVIAELGATITDVYSVFSRTNSWEGTGGVTFQSQSLTSFCDWDADQDRFIFGVTVTQTSGQAIDFSVDGDVEGPVTLDTPLATFEGTITACGTSVVLTGGATISQYVLDGGGDGALGAFPIVQGSGHIAWSGTFPPATGIAFGDSAVSPSTVGRVNFCGDAGQEVWIAYRYAGTDYPLLVTDGGGNAFLGFGTVPQVILDAATSIYLTAPSIYLSVPGSEILVSSGGMSLSSNEGISVGLAGVLSLVFSAVGTGTGLGIQSAAVPLGTGGVVALTLAEGICPGLALTGALAEPTTLVFNDAPGLWFVDTSQVTGISVLNTLTFANASGATTNAISVNANLYLVWLDSRGPNTIMAAALPAV
jgi:hypothetical protein